MHFFSITNLNAWLVVSSFQICARPAHRHKHNSSSTFLFTFPTSDPSFPMYAASPEHAANIIKYNWLQAERGIYASFKTLSVQSQCVIWDLDARQGTYALYTSLLGCNVMAVFHPTVHIGFENQKRVLLQLSIAKNRVDRLLPLEPMNLSYFSLHPPPPSWLLHRYGISLPHTQPQQKPSYMKKKALLFFCAKLHVMPSNEKTRKQMLQWVAAWTSIQAFTHMILKVQGSIQQSEEDEADSSIQTFLHDVGRSGYTIHILQQHNKDTPKGRNCFARLLTEQTHRNTFILLHSSSLYEGAGMSEIQVPVYLIPRFLHILNIYQEECNLWLTLFNS